MFSLIATIHVIVTVVLILLVLVQDSKGGAGMFAGGSSQSILGATGGATLLAKLTRGTAITFAITCISLTIYTTRQGQSVIDNTPIPTGTTPPAAPPATDAAPAKTEVNAKMAAPKPDIKSGKTEVSKDAPKEETKKK